MLMATLGLVAASFTMNHCIAENVYHEARGEGLFGMSAVASVTYNRSYYRDQTMCEVVYAPYQFSWTHQDVRFAKKEWKALAASYAVSFSVLAGWLPDVTQGSDHYHTTSIKPNWDYSKLTETVVINHHKFYRSK